MALVILAIAGFIIYKSFFDGSSGDVTAFGGGEATTTMSVEGNDIVNMVSEINTININPGLFSSPLFSGLVDFSVSLLPEPQGRSNPFADIGNDSGSVATSSAKATTK